MASPLLVSLCSLSFALQLRCNNSSSLVTSTLGDNYINLSLVTNCAPRMQGRVHRVLHHDCTHKYGRCQCIDGDLIELMQVIPHHNEAYTLGVLES